MEAQFKEPLETLLPRLLNEMAGTQQVADHLYVSKATLGYWMLKLGIRRVVIGPYEKVVPV